MDEDAIRRLGAAARDAASGATFVARSEALLAALRRALGDPLDLFVFTYDKKRLFPDRSGLPRIDFGREHFWGSNAEAAALYQREYGEHWVRLDPIPQIAGRVLHRAHLYEFDWRGGGEFEVDFCPRLGLRHDLVAGLDVFREHGLAFCLLRGPDGAPFSASDRRAIQALYDDVLLAYRSVLLGEQVAALRAEPAGARRDLGCAVLSLRGEVLEIEAGARRLLGEVALEDVALASLLARGAHAQARRAPSRRADELVLTRPRRRGGFIEARFARLVGAPARAVLILRTLAAGTAERLEASGAAANLTARQRGIALGAVQGKSNREIAAELGLSAETVKRHLAAVLRKLGAFDRHELRVRLLGTDADQG